MLSRYEGKFIAKFHAWKRLPFFFFFFFFLDTKEIMATRNAPEKFRESRETRARPFTILVTKRLKGPSFNT